MQSRAIVFTRPGEVQIRQFDLRPAGPGEVLIESAFTAVSPGTELRRLRGKEALGDVRFPFVPGYCLAGRVLTAGPGVALRPGTPVITCGTVDAGGFGLAEGGHVSHAVAPIQTVVEVPGNVDLLDASLAILGGICYHGLQQSRPQAKDKVAAVGLGAIGQLAARLHALSGADVVGCDLSEARVRLANEAGIRSVVTSGDLSSAFSGSFPEGVDVVVDSTGIPRVIHDALAILRRRDWNPIEDSGCCRYLIQGSYEGSFSVPYPEAYAAQLTILIPKGSQASDWRAALQLISQGRLQVRDLISEVCSVENARAVYDEFRRPGSRFITAAFRWAL